MERLPFGVGRLDGMLGGGAPRGTSVLLAGESGAGAREFAYTAAAMNALGRTDADGFDLYYGDLHEEATLPAEVHYLSFTSGRADVAREMRDTMADDVVEKAVEAIQFRDFSAEYFQLSPIPREWYVGETATIHDLGERHNNQDVLGALGDYLTAHAAGNLVVVDSISDLVGAVGDDLSWSDITTVVRGLSKAANNWAGLILLLVNVDTLSPTEFGSLKHATDGTFEFDWETGGSRRARAMTVQELRGVLSQLEADDIVRFETEIHEGGFDISDVRKIR